MPLAVCRPEVVSAPLAQMFTNQSLCLLCKPERDKMESLPPPCLTLAATAAKRGGE